MIKITVRYPDETELKRFLHITGPYIVKCKPNLSKPAQKGSESSYYKREIWLETAPKT